MKKILFKALSVFMVTIFTFSFTALTASAQDADQSNINNLPRKDSTQNAPSTPSASGTQSTPNTPKVQYNTPKTNGHYHYFGSQLDTPQERQLYSCLENEMLTSKKSTTSVVVFDPPIKLTSNPNNQSALELEAMVKLKAAIDAFKFDHPEMYWITGNSSLAKVSIGQMSDGGVYLTKAAAYLELAQTRDGDGQAINQVVNQIVAEASKQPTHLERLKTVHNMLAKHITYGGASYRAFQANGALVDKLATCEGYAKAAKIIMDRLGYENVLVGGYGYNKGQKIAHMWNYVKIDGNWYAMDITWDDQKILVYDYFLAGKNTVAPNFGSRTFSQEHVEEYTFSYLDYEPFYYPKLSGNAYR